MILPLVLYTKHKRLSNDQPLLGQQSSSARRPGRKSAEFCPAAAACFVLGCVCRFHSDRRVVVARVCTLSCRCEFSSHLRDSPPRPFYAKQLARLTQAASKGHWRAGTHTLESGRWVSGCKDLHPCRPRLICGRGLLSPKVEFF